MVDGVDWQRPPERPTLAVSDVHVWRVVVANFRDEVAAHSVVLDEAEAARAARFVRASDRERFTVTRARLRSILARYLSLAPAQLTFRYGPQGKPALADGGNSLAFNVSHTREVALYAITPGPEVGVDVERIRPDYDFGVVTDRFFSAAEARALRALPPALQREAFFQTWVRKEAYIKARGGGLTIPLDKFEVSMFPEPPALRRMVGEPAEASRWAFYGFRPWPGHVAALAVAGRAERLAFFDLSPAQML